MRIVRSANAHGVLKNVDVAEAKALRGVVAVWTASDIADLPPIDFREGPIEKLAPFRQPVLARDYVRYVGEPVAAVFATDPYIAEDAADLVIVEVDDLPVLVDAAAPVADFVDGLDDRADDLPPRLWRGRRGLPQRRPHRRNRCRDRPPFRRAAGDARRHRPL